MLRRYEVGRIKSSRGRTIAALCIAAWLCIAPGAVALPLAPPRAESMEITTVKFRGVKWVRSATRMSAVFPVPLEAFRAVLVDFGSYPTFVPHLASVDLITAPSGIPAMRQHFLVKILGFSFTSVVAMTIEPDDSLLPDRWRTDWSFLNSDGTIGGITGHWELEDASEDGESRVFVRHVNDGLVRKRVPFQTLIMRSVAERELAGAFLSAYHEALRRWPRLGASGESDAEVDSLPSYRPMEGPDE